MTIAVDLGRKATKQQQLTLDLQASLFWGLMPSRLHTSIATLTHSLQDFLGLSHPLGPGMAILVIEFVQEDVNPT